MVLDNDALSFMSLYRLFLVAIVLVALAGCLKSSVVYRFPDYNGVLVERLALAVPAEDLAATRLVLRREALQHAHDAWIRLQRVAYPLLKANVGECPDQFLFAGFAVANAESYRGPYADLARPVFGLSSHLQVVDLQPGSAAARAGLRLGDRLQRVDDHAVGVGSAAGELFYSALRDAYARVGGAQLEVRRGQDVLQTYLRPERVCGYPVRLIRTGQPDAHAGDGGIFVSLELLALLEHDGDLAFVVAHELAHHVLGHVRFRFFSPRHSREQETRADQYAVELMHNAALPLDRVTTFWSRYARHRPLAIESKGFLDRHPSYPERIERLREVVARHCAQC